MQPQPLPVRPERLEARSAQFGLQVERAEVPAAVQQLAAVEERQRMQVLGCAHRRLGAQAVDERQRRRHRLAEQGAQDVVFGLEVVIQRGLTNTDGLGDGAGRRAGVAEGREEFACRVEDLVTCGRPRPPLGPQPWDGPRE